MGAWYSRTGTHLSIYAVGARAAMGPSMRRSPALPRSTADHRRRRARAHTCESIRASGPCCMSRASPTVPSTG